MLYWWTLQRAKAGGRESRKRAIKRLGDTRERRALKCLLQVLADPDLLIRRAAAEALEKIDPSWKQSSAAQAAQHNLLETLKHSAPDRRKGAAFALGELSDPSATAALITALDEENVEVRQEVARALAKMRTPAVDPLLRLLRSGDPHLRQVAAEALGELEDPQTLEPLLVTLRDSRWEVRCAGATALGRIGDARAFEGKLGEYVWIKAVLNDWNYDVMSAARKALGQVEPEWGKSEAARPAVRPLMEALQDPEVRVREAAATALGKIADEEALQPLVTALSDGDESVRREVAKALGKIRARAMSAQ